jgi:hypothetical protein
VRDRRDLLPAEGITYYAFADPSGGVRDAFTVAIGHTTDDGRTIVDCVRAWTPPLSPPQVIAEAAALVRSYRVSAVEGDRYAGEFPHAIFAEHGIVYRLCELDRSALYLAMLPRVLAGAVELPNDPALLRELRGLERRRGFAGRDRVDHRGRAHDDRANACAGVIHVARPHRSHARMIPTEGHGYGAELAEAFGLTLPGDPAVGGDPLADPYVVARLAELQPA